MLRNIIPRTSSTCHTRSPGKSNTCKSTLISSSLKEGYSSVKTHDYYPRGVGEWTGRQVAADNEGRTETTVEWLMVSEWSIKLRSKCPAVGLKTNREAQREQEVHWGRLTRNIKWQTLELRAQTFLWLGPLKRLSIRQTIGRLPTGLTSPTEISCGRRSKTTGAHTQARILTNRWLCLHCKKKFAKFTVKHFEIPTVTGCDTESIILPYYQSINFT